VGSVDESSAGDLTHSGAAIGYAIEQRFPTGAVELVKLSGW
jgi:hypothetical protein